MSTEKIVRLVQDLLSDESPETISPALIEQKIDEAVKFKPAWTEGLDRPKAIAELIRRYSLWIGTDATLSSDEGHIAWLNASRKSDWRYWARYEQYLESRMSPVAVRALDKTTDNILGHLEDPKRTGPWDRRGLVVGHVQSGKTGNYTGLICKAADAGYKIIIVLAGLHNNLRAQTQIRLDEGFLGFETSPNRENLKPIGVGLIDSDLSIRPNYVTDRSDGGDFNTSRARMGISPEQRPWLFVIKKNKTILERLLHWIRNHVADAKDATGRRIVTHLPLLVIDDEADNASVDTGEQIFDAEGVPDPEYEPKAINRLIRSIVHSFQRSAYVGYTATPFANIFIHESGATSDEGPDLFPAAFIVSLATPSTYIGPAKVFGLRTQNGRSPDLGIFRNTDEIDEKHAGTWIPEKHDKHHRPASADGGGLPLSLRTAIESFVIACAVRELRGQGGEHTSMLVHVTRFINVQNAVFEQVSEHVEDLLQRVKRKVRHAEILQRMQQQWEDDFVPRAHQMRLDFPELFDEETLPDWKAIEAILVQVLTDIEVRVINGSAKDALDYADQSARGLKVIAVGGDKLSRGLTLEGLVTSYFLRSSKMYDTLMQMGRWFGYRPGYIDLCRLYSTGGLRGWFSHIADAAEELRAEFDMMTQTGATPRQFGLKVQSHPVLMVTSAVKMRSARNLMLSFSGHGVETVSLFDDRTILGRNFDAMKTLVSNIEDKRRPSSKRGSWNGFIWEGVDAQHIVQFLGAYRTNPEALKVNSVLLAEFIRSMQPSGELKEWTVALAKGGTGAKQEIIPAVLVNMIKRTAFSDEKGYSIGRLLSPPDEAVDLDDAQFGEALRITRELWAADTANKRRAIKEPEIPSGLAIRRVRGLGGPGIPGRPETGLLLLYLLDPAEAEQERLKGLPPVAAFGMSFPASNTGTKVPYKVNNVGWELDYAGG